MDVQPGIRIILCGTLDNRIDREAVCGKIKSFNYIFIRIKYGRNFFRFSIFTIMDQKQFSAFCHLQAVLSQANRHIDSLSILGLPFISGCIYNGNIETPQFFRTIVLYVRRYDCNALPCFVFKEYLALIRQNLVRAGYNYGISVP